MNICSNCGKEVAEDAAHCGHCGHRLEVEQKKTMMGLGAIDPEWREKLEVARDESSAAAEPQEDLEMAPTQMMDALGAPPVAGDDDEGFVTAPTAAMDAAVAPEVEEDLFPDASGDEILEGSVEPTADFEPARVDLESPEPQVDFPDTATAEIALGEESGAETPKPDVVTDDRFGATVEAPLGQGGTLATSGDDSIQSGADDEDGQKRKLMIVVGIIGLILFCCCIGNIINFVILPMF